MDETFKFVVGERLKEARKALALQQETAAAKAGVTREQWGRYERGLAAPGGEVLAACAAMGIDVLYVLTGARTPGVPVLSGDHTLSREEAALLDNYRNSSPEGRRAISTTSAALAQPAKAVKRAS